MASRGRWTIVRDAFHRWPALQRISLHLLDSVYVVALWPFRRPYRRETALENGAPSSRTDELNAAAERYFAEQRDTAYLLGKPFSDPANAARHLIDAGVLMGAMRLRPGDVVAEIGAGTCWLSHMLNRFGCRTIAIDVSSTALALGRVLFESDPRTNWSLQPEFVAYDGRTIPLPADACDRIIINDAFHHVLNRRELLVEMFRVLRPDGMIAMAEPGSGHVAVAPSQAEAATGVLETDVEIEEVESMARESGFAAVHVVAASASVVHEVPVRRLGAFMGGSGFAAYWKQFCGSLDRHHYVVIYKGDPTPTTMRPAVLSASLQWLEPRGGGSVRLRCGEPARVTVNVRNLGTTVWLAREGPGWTRIGVHLERSQQLLDFDWHRAALPFDVPPGGRFRLALTLPPLPSAGSYQLVLDLVIEGHTWFAAHGSATLGLDLEVV